MGLLKKIERALRPAVKAVAPAALSGLGSTIAGPLGGQVGRQLGEVYTMSRPRPEPGDVQMALGTVGGPPPRSTGTRGVDNPPDRPGMPRPLFGIRHDPWSYTGRKRIRAILYNMQDYLGFPVNLRQGKRILRLALLTGGANLPNTTPEEAAVLLAYQPKHRVFLSFAGIRRARKVAGRIRQMQRVASEICAPRRRSFSLPKKRRR